jgi:hypothetical protein
MKTCCKSICIFLALSLLTGTAGPTLAATDFALRAQEATVEPASISLSLTPGESATETITVTTAPTPIPKVDVLFLFDVTSSMSDVLGSAKDQGIFIMDTLREQVADSAFGVASFADYPGHYDYAGYASYYGAASDYPWSLGVDITTDAAAVQRGIESLNLLDGEDGPECYSRAMFEAMYVDWRPAAKHIIVLFGDAPAHDTEFYQAYGENFGVDPGVDAEAGTLDDLSFTNVVAQVKDRGIEIIPVNSDLDDLDFVQAGFDYMATQTGGEVYQLHEVEDLPDIVAAGLTEATSVISSLSLIPDPGYEDWVLMSPADHSNVGGGETRTFKVMITVPPDADPGEHAFSLTVTGDFATLGITVVNVTTGGISLDPAEIRARKYQLIQNLSAPEFETELLEGRWTWTPGVGDTYAADEEAVEDWLNGLDWNSLTPAELAAVHGLTVQEEALWELMQAQAETSHIGNSQVSHIVGLIFSVVSIVKFMDKLEGKHVVGLLATKLKNYVYSKLVSLATTVILWFTDQLPADPALEHFRMQVRAMGETFEDVFERSLKKEKITGDLLKTLLAEAMVHPMNIATNKIYVERTKGLVSDGLSTAQQMTEMSIALDDVQVQASLVVQQVSGEVGVAVSERQSIEAQTEEVEAAQNTLSIVSDVASTASTVATLTGLGALPAQIGHAISLVLKLVDAALSVSLGYRAYGAWWSTPDAAANVTTLSFACDPTSPTLTAADRSPMLTYWDALACAAISDVPRATILSDYTLSQLARVEADVATYRDLLDQLAAAVRAGGVETAETVTENLLDADQALSDTFLVARQPIFAGARTALDSGGAAFESAYSDFGRGASSFDGEGAILYVYLLGWFYDPANTENQTLLLDQIEVVKSSTENYQAALETTLTYVEGVATQPSVLVTGYTLPGLSVGTPATLQVEVSNPTPNPAEDVTVTFDPGQNAQATSQGPFSLGSLAGGASTMLEIRFTPRNSEGFLSLSTSASNGSGTFRIIPFAAVGSVGGGGFGVAIIVLVVAIVGLGIYALTQGRRRQLVAAGVGVVGGVPPAASLVILRGPDAGRRIPLTGAMFTIGRSRDSALHLSESNVSRHHAVLRFAHGRWFLQDQGSAIGTFVNGQRVSATPLSDGDTIRIGDTEFQFRVD